MANGGSMVAITGCFQVISGKDRKFYLTYLLKKQNNNYSQLKYSGGS